MVYRSFYRHKIYRCEKRTAVHRHNTDKFQAVLRQTPTIPFWLLTSPMFGCYVCHRKAKYTGIYQAFTYGQIF